MLIQSTITGKTYDTDKCVYIVNHIQAYKYIDNGAELLDLKCGEDDKFVYVFSRYKTKELYAKWCDYTL